MSEVLRDFPEVCAPLKCMFDSFFAWDLNSPLKKQEQTWGNSYLAVVCGNVTGSNTKDRRKIRVAPDFLSFFKFA